MTTRLKDMTGMTFGRLTVIDRDLSKKGGAAHWNCICNCGTMKSISGSSLREGLTQSCGCLCLERIKETVTTHAASRIGQREPTHIIWANMKARCYNTNRSDYHQYGGRGITVCDRWLNSYVNFLEDMGPRPKGLSLDRIDNNKGYSKDNCRWATPTEQNNNKRSNILLSFKGKTQSISAWAKDLGFNPEVIRKRIRIRGWDVERALTTPLKSNIERNEND